MSLHEQSYNVDSVNDDWGTVLHILSKGAGRYDLSTPHGYYIVCHNGHKYTEFHYEEPQYGF